MTSTLGIDAADAVLKAYGLRATREPTRVGRGSLNWNWRVETEAGARFLRRHRTDLSKAGIEAEHALVAWVAARGIPVAYPIPTARGATVLEHDSGLWALFPWVDGSSPVRGALNAEQARAAGEMHGRIHRVLADYPGPRPTSPLMAFDTAASLARLERIIGVAEQQRAEDWLLEGMRRQVALLHQYGDETADIASLTSGLAHGDYHDQQLLFDSHDRIVAVTDWEMFGNRPFVYEVIRSLWFSQLMEQPTMADYIAGYREQTPLAVAEWRLGMELWWQSRLHSTWVSQELFLEGNQRVAEFVAEEFRVLGVLADERTRGALTERLVRAARG